MSNRLLIKPDQRLTYSTQNLHRYPLRSNLENQQCKHTLTLRSKQNYHKGIQTATALRQPNKSILHHLETVFNFAVLLLMGFTFNTIAAGTMVKGKHAHTHQHHTDNKSKQSDCKSSNHKTIHTPTLIKYCVHCDYPENKNNNKENKTCAVHEKTHS